MSQEKDRDRRRAPRAWIGSTAIVRDDRDASSRYAVDNLSSAGAFLSGGPLVPCGATVRMVLNLAGEPPLAIVAKVIRHATCPGEPPALGVVFVSMSAHAKDRIHLAVVAAGGPGETARSGTHRTGLPAQEWKSGRGR